MSNWQFVERLRALVKDQDLVVAFEMNTEGKILCTITFDAPGDGDNVVVGGGRDLPEALEDASGRLASARAARAAEVAHA